MNHSVALLLFCLTVALAFEPGGYVEISLVTYFDAVRQLPSGECCQGSPLNGICTLTCRNELHACLKNSNSSERNSSSFDSGCLSEFSTDVFATTRSTKARGDWAVQKYSFGRDEASRQLSFVGSLTDGLEVEMNVSNYDQQSSKAPITSFAFKLSEDVSLAANGNISAVGLTAPTVTARWIVFEWKLVCNENYYGKCDAFCVAADDDQRGHYTCDLAGNRVCLDGYRNASTSCLEIVDYCTCNPCQNGGDCNQTFACECPPDFPCDSPECKANPCRYSAQCKMRPSFECECSSKYHGQLCEDKKPLSRKEIIGIAVGLGVFVIVVVVILLCVCYQLQCWCFRNRSYATI